MAKSKQTIFSEFSLRLQINDSNDLAPLAQMDLVSIELAGFALNTIPTCTATVQLGRRLTKKSSSGSTSQFSEAHQLENILFDGRPFKHAHVYLTPKFQQGVAAGDSFDWPAGEFEIFEGFLTGYNYPRRNNSAYLALQITHWLLATTHSSMLIPELAPSSVLPQLVFALRDDSGSNPEAKARFCTTTVGLDVQEALQKNVWTGIQTFLTKIGNQEIIKIDNTPDTKLVGQLNLDNTDALSALKRIKSVFPGSAGEMALDAMGRSADTALLRALREGAADFLGDYNQREYAQKSFWSAIVGDFAPHFLFSIVPRIQDALAVPVLPGCQDIWFGDPRSAGAETINRDDYFFLQSSATVDRPLRGVILSGTVGSDSGLSTESPDKAPLSHLGEYFPDKYLKGRILSAYPPPWLARAIDASGRQPDGLTGIGQQQNVGGVGGVAVTAPANNAGGATTKQAYAGVSTIASRYARSLYVMESTRQRQCTIQGRLRFDIAPGSTVSVAGSPEKFLGADDTLAQNFVATVLSVSYVFSVEGPTALTTFRLGHYRTLKENTSDSYSVAEHPLYGKLWRGDYLEPKVQQ